VRAFRWVIIGVGILLGVPAFFVAVLKLSTFADNRLYAGRVFDGVVPYDRAIASRRYNIEGIDCTFAIVELAPDAPRLPPAKSLGPGTPPHHDPANAFGGEWVPTPGPALKPTNGDGPWTTCYIAFGEDLYGRLGDAVAEPGGWWRADLLGNRELHVYSPSTSLAFVLYEGD
jgi:hypothetical protein